MSRQAASLFRVAMSAWSRDAGERLKAAVKAHGTQDAFCLEAAISRTTLNRYYGGADPGDDNVARFAELLGTTAAHLVGADEDVVGIVEVPVYDIEVAAGAGREVFANARPLFHWAFPEDWAAANLGDTSAIMMFRVVGDSQWPELGDGDLIAVDTRSRRAGDDMHVVRVGDALKVKRIVREGGIVRLLSRNELYPEEVVQLGDGGDAQFEIIGRAVWASKLL